MSTHHFISIDGIKTHYLEAGTQHRGRRPTVLLLHSAEFGGAAELSWEYNIDVLAAHYHVLAPDHLGFGRTDKVFDFNGQFDKRIAHIRRFIETMCVGAVHVIGSSMSGGLCLTVAARTPPDWPVLSVVCCSGGGDAPNNEERKILNSYDGSEAHMRRIIDVMFVDPRWAQDDAYIARRQSIAHLPGAWEATAAARFKSSFASATSQRRERDNINYANIKVPVLVMAGRKDSLRLPNYTDQFVPQIPNCELHIFEEAGHMGNIECAAEFNERVLSFLHMHD
jgi:pimeloyl-ACP methyl ester carboxylesterase